MANLLSNEVQQAIFNRMMARIVLVTTLLLSLVGCMAIGALVPAYFTLHTEEASLSYEIAALSQSGIAGGISGRDSVSATNKRIRVMQALLAQPEKISEAIALIVASKPKGMTIEHISYDPAMAVASTTAHTITVSGVLSQSGDQATFLAALRSHAMFTQVEIPISALARSDKNALTVVLHGTF